MHTVGVGALLIFMKNFEFSIVWFFVKKNLNSTFLVVGGEGDQIDY